MRERTWFRRLMSMVAGPSAGHAVVALVVGLAACWMAAWWSGHATAVSRHLFYLPVLFASVRFGPVVAVATGVVAGLLGGPLVPLPEVQAELNTVEVWGGRMLFFVAAGGFTGLLVELLRIGQQERDALAAGRRQIAEEHALFIQTVSHELRTPLTAIYGSVELLTSNQQLAAPQRRALEEALREGVRRLRVLTETVLGAVGATDTAEQEPVDLLRLVPELLDQEGQDPDRALVDVAPDAATVITSVPHLRLALHALLSNAAKFSDPTAHIHVTAVRRCGDVEIVVRDHGPGIDPEFIDRAFSAFTQHDPSSTREYGGMGLGLFVAARSAERLNATITLEPHPERGTVATLVLPQRRQTDPRGVVRKATVAAEGAHLGGESRTEPRSAVPDASRVRETRN